MKQPATSGGGQLRRFAVHLVTGSATLSLFTMSQKGDMSESEDDATQEEVAQKEQAGSYNFTHSQVL